MSRYIILYQSQIIGKPQIVMLVEMHINDLPVVEFAIR